MSLVGADGVKTEKNLTVSSDETNSLKVLLLCPCDLTSAFCECAWSVALGI